MPSTAFNAFGGATNPATLAAITAPGCAAFDSGIETTSLIADGPLFDLPAGAAKLAVGLERREESLEHTVAESAGSRGKGRRMHAIAVTWDRRSLELSIPLVGSAENPHAAPRLELTLAGRYENYSDFGHTSQSRSSG